MKLSNSLMCAAAIALAGCNGTQKEFNLTSPVMEPSRIALEFADGDSFGSGLKGAKGTLTTIDRKVDAPFYRQSAINEKANELHLALNDSSAVTFRAYDDGVAYRIETDYTTPRTVVDETAEFNLAGAPEMLVPIVKGFRTSFEMPYTAARPDTFSTSPSTPTSVKAVRFSSVSQILKAIRVCSSPHRRENLKANTLRYPTASIITRLVCRKWL